MHRLLALALLSLAAAAAGAVPLEWGWARGDEQFYRLDETMTQRITGPQESRLEWNRRLAYRQRVLETENGEATVERTFLWVEITVERDARDPVRYDSRNKTVIEPEHAMLIEPFAALPGRSIVFDVDSEGNVGRVEGDAETIDAMLGPLSTGRLAGLLPSFKGRQTREQRLARQLEQALGLIPGRSADPGETWPVGIDHVTPLAGRLVSDVEATLVRWDSRGQLATIEIEGTLRQEDEPGRPGRLVPVSLRRGEVAGEVGFNTRLGRIERAEMALDTEWMMDAPSVPSGNPAGQTISQRTVLERLDDPDATP
jgi:hypothetical protein